MKFLSKRVCDYTSFHSDLDFTKHGHSSGSTYFLKAMLNCVYLLSIFPYK
ncbi:hypothetical protein RhiirA1_486552 [Rhizophagus irregularis]|uniref:Uncharacterized protein n=1 Tax=Rhizophagus irregularis TaxID=588596 RepID=A0A2N0QH45_9GLOM|nr:hypothetical protein RhiirA1_486552 [Rhizophagus irregularis]